MSSPFERAIAVSELGDGRYGAEIVTEFNGPVAPNGGVLAALMLRAAERELGPGAPPARTVSAHYLAAPTPGRAELAVEVLRRGPRVCACEVRLRQGDRLACQTTIIFSAARSQPIALHRTPAQLPPYDPAATFDDALLPGAPPLFSRMRLQPTLGGPPFSGGEEALTGGWVSLRDDDAPLDPARLCALSDLWWPAVFGVLTEPSGVPTLQLTVHLRVVAEPVSAPVFARFETREITEGHLEETGELWGKDGRLLVESRQLALL